MKDEAVVPESEAIEGPRRTCEPEPVQDGEPVRRNVQKGTGVITRTVARLIDGRHEARPLERNSERRSRYAAPTINACLDDNVTVVSAVMAASSFTMPSPVPRVFLDLAAVSDLAHRPCGSAWVRQTGHYDYWLKPDTTTTGLWVRLKPDTTTTMRSTMKPPSKPTSTRKLVRSSLTQSIGRSVSRFQDSSNEFDDVAAEILALDRRDLSCMTMLLFRGASADELAAALHLQRGIVTTTLERLQLAGYARFEPGNGTRIELTEHARKWIERIWAPVREDGDRLLEGYPVQQLAVFARFLQQVCEVLEGERGSCAPGWRRPSQTGDRICVVGYHRRLFDGCSCSSKGISGGPSISTTSPRAAH